MEANAINPTHTATITNVEDGTTEVVNLYTIPANLTAEEFEAYFNALLAKVVA